MNKLIIKSRIVKLAIFAMSAVMIAMMMGNLYYRDRVYITDNGVTREMMTSETDVYAILRSAEYTLGAHDLVTYESIDESTAYITIHRSFNVNVTADGKTTVVPVIGGTAAEVLAKAGVEIGEHDTIDCELTDTVYAGMNITVTRISYEVRTNETEIPLRWNT